MLSRAVAVSGRAMARSGVRAATAVGVWSRGERWGQEEGKSTSGIQQRSKSVLLPRGTSVPAMTGVLGNVGEFGLRQNSAKSMNSLMYTIQKLSYGKKSSLASLLEEDHEPLEVGVPPALKKGDVALVGTEGELVSQQIPYREVLARAQEELLTIKVVDESGDKLGRPIVRFYTTDQIRNQEQAQQDRLELDKQTKKKEKIKELRFSSVIAEGDVQTKIDRVEGFLLKGYKVRICVVFKKVWTFDEPLAHDILHNVLDRVKPLGELVPNSISTARATLFGMIQPNQEAIDQYIANDYTLVDEEEEED